MSASKLKLYWRLQLAAHFLQKRADRDLLENGKVTTAQLGVLAVIGNGKNVTQKDVAIALGLNESAITAMVKRLMGFGYVERHKSEHDGRAKLLNLTETGRAIHQNTNPPFRKINARIESVLSEAEIENLAENLDKLTEAFK